MDLNPGTQNYMDDDREAAFARNRETEAAVSALPYSSNLRQGSSGSEVEKIQQQLANAGFDPGPADGIFGPNTAAAVRQFQEQHAPPVDGIVGPITKKALDEHGAEAPASAVQTEEDQEEVGGGGGTDFIFSGDYSLQDIQSSLDGMYESAPPMVKARAAHTKAVIEKSKERMRKTYVHFSEDQWG